MEVEIRAEEFFVFAKRKAKNLCIVRGCPSERTGHGDRYCYKHKQQLFRARFPTKAAFAALRAHAKSRNIPFKLAFSEFAELIAGTTYLANHNNAHGGLHVDREDTKKPYQAGNVQLLPISDHSVKSNRERWGCYTWQHKKSIERRRKKEDPEMWDDSDANYEQGEGDPF